MNDHDSNLCDCWECKEARLLAAELAQDPDQAAEDLLLPTPFDAPDGDITDDEAEALLCDQDASGLWFPGT